MQKLETWIRLECDQPKCKMWANVQSVPANGWWHAEGKDYCPQHNGAKVYGGCPPDHTR